MVVKNIRERKKVTVFDDFNSSTSVINCSRMSNKLAVIIIMVLLSILYLPSFIYTRQSTWVATFDSKERNIPGMDNGKLQASPPPCLVFLHVPKVGGRTVKEVLNKVAEQMGFRLVNIYSKDFTRPLKLAANGTVTTGHFTTALFDLNPNMTQCYAMTVLREPVDRAISAFFYHEHVYPGEIQSCLNPHNNTLPTQTLNRQLAKRHRQARYQGSNRGKCRFNWQYSNDQTRRFAGLPDTKWNAYLENKYHSSPPNHTHLDHAKEQLVKNFDIICFLEDLTSCVQRLLEAFHLNQNATFVNETLSMVDKTNNMFMTKSRPADKLNDMTMNLFREVNNLDLELYDWAVARSNIK